jgi:hypothetical protein
MPEISRLFRKRKTIGDARSLIENTKPRKRQKKNSSQPGGTVTNTIQSFGFNYSTLKFKPLQVYETFIRAKGNAYSKALIKTFISFVSCARYLPECVELNNVTNWDIQKADEVIQTHFENLQKEYSNSILFSFEDHMYEHEVQYQIKDYAYEDYIVIYEEVGSHPGAIFIEDFNSLNETDKRIAFQALKILNTDFNISFWTEIPQWDYISQAVQEDADILEDLKNEKLSDEEFEEALGENGGHGFSKWFIEQFNNEWDTGKFTNQIRYIDGDYEDLYDRAQLDDCFSIWLKCVLYLQSTNFNLWDYSFEMEGECSPVNTYCMMLRCDEFIDQYDSYTDGMYEHYPGLRNLKIITPDGVLKNTINSGIEDFVELLFSYNPKTNSFYDSFLTTERIDTYASYLHLSDKEQGELRRIIDNRRPRNAYQF